MSVLTLNNNDVASIVKDAYYQLNGAYDIDTLDLEGLIDFGTTEGIADSRDQFFGALLNVMRDRKYVDRALGEFETDPFYVDSAEWGALTEVLSIDVPDIQSNSAWKAFTSGTTTIGEYTVYLPIVDSKIYGLSQSWALPVTISHEQSKTAFDSAEKMATLVNYIYMVIGNKIKEHRVAMNRANRNNFIAEKIAYANSDGASGVHVIDIISEYVNLKGDPTKDFSITDFLNSKDAKIFASQLLELYAGYLSEPSVLFNTEEKDRFVPRSELVVQVLKAFETELEYSVDSDVYHNNIVALPNHQSINAWQGIGGTGFDDVSTIDVTTSHGDDIVQTGIVCFMADPRAIMHTIVSERVGIQYFSIEDVTHSEYQYVDRYANNLGMPALVFVLNPYVAVN